jgi:hypothetical protein
VRDDTPYRDRPEGEVRREQECMRRIFAAAPPVRLIWEAFGGLGKTAQVLSERFPQAEIQATEIDAACVDAYNRLSLPNATCYRASALEFGFSPAGRAHGVSLDFNRLTLLDLWGRPEGCWKVGLVERALRTGPLWLQVTDSAASHMHLNWKKYDILVPTVEGYVGRFSRELRERWELRLLAWSGHSRATYMLFTPVALLRPQVPRL